MRYEVQTEFFGDKWENIWQTDEIPETFNTLDNAIDAIRDHVTNCINAVESGYMEDSPSQDSFRIVEGNNVYIWTGAGWDYALEEY